MEKSPVERCTETKTVGNLLPFYPRRRSEESRRFDGARKLAPAPVIGRLAESSAVVAGHALRLARRSSYPQFLGAAACLVAWTVFWLLTIVAIVDVTGNELDREPSENPVAASVLPTPKKPAVPYERQYWDADRQIIDDSASLLDPPRSCLPGMIELDGRCVLGEEILVRPLSSWRKR